MLYEHYLPLLETMRGRRWVLNSDPVTFPVGLNGNVFHRRSGGYVVSFFVTDALLSNQLWRNASAPAITLRLPAVKGVKATRWMSTAFTGERPLPVEWTGKELRACLPQYAVAGVILID